jgi:uncharacterized protein (TIGR02453 family)
MPTTKVETFSGFSPKALRFLRELKKNNERAWFQPRKELYERELLGPLHALSIDVTNALRKAKIPIAADPRRAHFRIYRDIRFSRDKSPYKTNLGTYLPYKGLRGAPGGLYIHIEPKESFMAVAFYQLDKQLLQRWREAMAADPKRFQRMLGALERNGVRIGEQTDTLKRMPRGFEAFAESPIADYFRYPGFTVSEKLSEADVSDKRLVKRSVDLVKKAKPLLEYGWRVLDG